MLRPPAGDVPARREGDLAFVAGRPEWAPAFGWTELASPEEVEALEPPASGLDAYWAWTGPGIVRARVFPLDLGIEEDEATGAAAVRARLAARASRWRSTRAWARSSTPRPRDDGLVEIGGRVSA